MFLAAFREAYWGRACQLSASFAFCCHYPKAPPHLLALQLVRGGGEEGGELLTLAHISHSREESWDVVVRLLDRFVLCIFSSFIHLLIHRFFLSLSLAGMHFSLPFLHAIVNAVYDKAPGWRDQQAGSQWTLIANFEWHFPSPSAFKPALFYQGGKKRGLFLEGKTKDLRVKWL